MSSYNFPNIIAVDPRGAQVIRNDLIPRGSNILDIGTRTERFRDAYIGGVLYASNVVVEGDYITVNAVSSNSEQMVITNLGTGPALVVRQSGTQPVAEFIDAESGSALFIGNSGAVGINTNISGQSLTVNGNVALSGGNRFIGTETANTMSVRTNNVDQLVIDTNGNVGIGTTVPLAELHVLQTGAAPAFRVDDVASDTTPFLIDANGNVGIGTANPRESLHVEAGNIALGGANSFVGTRTNHNLSLRTNGVDRVTILSGGNVGIGTTVPTAKLHVRESHGIGKLDMIQINYDQNWGLRLVQNFASMGDIHYEFKHTFNTVERDILTFKDQNVGIGTTNPTYPFDIYNNGYIQQIVRCPIQGNPGHLVVRNDHYNQQIQFRTKYLDGAILRENHIFTWNGSSIDTLQLNNIITVTSSAVGIGTTFPSTIAENLLLDVNGSIKVDGILSHRGRGGTYSANKINFSWHADSAFRMWVDGEHVKTFVINHPVNQDKYLVHACLEGPENAVFYRGKSQLNDEGFAIVNLPSYFTALVDEDTATVHITPILTNCTILQQQCCTACSLATSEVTNGSFIVKMVGGINICHQKFYWQVMATRKDVPILNVEPFKNNVEVRGDGPYKYIV